MKRRLTTIGNGYRARYDLSWEPERPKTTGAIRSIPLSVAIAASVDAFSGGQSASAHEMTLAKSGSQSQATGRRNFEIQALIIEDSDTTDLSDELLKHLSIVSPPPQAWFDGDEEKPF